MKKQKGRPGRRGKQRFKASGRAPGGWSGGRSGVKEPVASGPKIKVQSFDARALFASLTDEELGIMELYREGVQSAAMRLVALVINGGSTEIAFSSALQNQVDAVEQLQGFYMSVITDEHLERHAGPRQ